jgi:ubiquinol-cytochrome c reductase subunit 10
MAIWGLTAGLGVSLYLSEVPLFQKDVLRKIPFVSISSELAMAEHS